MTSPTLAELQAALSCCWARDTSEDPDEWSEENPTRGQCAATALVVRDYLGGEILIGDVLLDGKLSERHAWNRLPSGEEVDLTRDQFRRGETISAGVPDEPLAIKHAGERVALLRSRVAAELAR